MTSRAPHTNLANPPAGTEPGVTVARFATYAVGRTDVGRQRTTNEDAMLVDNTLGLYLVCDGMGGHASGQIASDLAVRTIAQSLKTGEPAPQNGEDPLQAAMQAANQTVYQRSQLDPSCHGMGTTAVGLRVEGDLLHICHCGDSRVYLLRTGKLSQLTRDHSLVNLYKDKPELEGQMGPASSNVIVRAIGLEERVEIDHRVVALEDGDIYLLCCDGLTDMVDDWMIREILTSGEALEVMGENLVRAANTNGGSDNITVVLVGVRSEAAAADRAEEALSRELDELEKKMYPGTRPGF
ncbi:MAG TPA: Stp1/IreP family PP2C-type Ser/Thr phosphatase [Kofleriaceae bacterium]|nr:Stp1/IreP family PP2C-type Ser/Thr phosphatase [Kofleriaceae bacterium]